MDTYVNSKTVTSIRARAPIPCSTDHGTAQKHGTLQRTEVGPAGQAVTLGVPRAAYRQGAAEAGDRHANGAVLGAGPCPGIADPDTTSQTRTRRWGLARLVTVLAPAAAAVR